MTIRATRRLALILAAGLVVGFAGTPVTAAGTDTVTAKPEGVAATSIKPKLRSHKRASHRKSEKATSQPSEVPKTAESTKAADAVPSALPAPIANANAQLTSAYAPTDTAAMLGRGGPTMIAASDKAGDPPPASEADVVASDQLNDVDRALQEQVQKEKERTQALQATPQTPPQTVAMVTSTTAPAPAATAESTSLDRTSLIGKIFIGVGALLTMASAARMFMA